MTKKRGRKKEYDWNILYQLNQLGYNYMDISRISGASDSTVVKNLREISKRNGQKESYASNKFQYRYLKRINPQSQEMLDIIKQLKNINELLIHRLLMYYRTVIIPITLYVVCKYRTLEYSYEEIDELLGLESEGKEAKRIIKKYGQFVLKAEHYHSPLVQEVVSQVDTNDIVESIIKFNIKHDYKENKDLSEFNLHAFDNHKTYIDRDKINKLRYSYQRNKNKFEVTRRKASQYWK